MSDDHACPAAHCGRPMRAGDVVCRRCWYVLPNNLKQAYQVALAALKGSRTRGNIEALLGAKKSIIDSVNPGR